MDALLKSLREFILTNGAKTTYWVAYSGGVDSHVLLHGLAQLRKEFSLTLRAVYVNHGWSQHANTWGEHCASVCATLDVPFTSIDLPEHAKQLSPDASPEAHARQFRYAIFADLLASQDFLLTAHHQTDQAETVLLQLMRGAGPKGLAAMPHVKPFAKGFHARPLLHLSREAIMHYAKENNLTWIEDESNDDVNLSRNFLRLKVMPLLKTHWSGITANLARVADNCAQASHLLEARIEEELEQVKGSAPNTLSVKKLLLCDVVMQAHLLRVWLQQLNFPLPSTVKLQQILQTVLLAREDKLPCVKWQCAELRRYRDNLYVMPALKSFDGSKDWSWDLRSHLSLENVGVLTAHRCEGQGLSEEITEITVRFRQGGEVCYFNKHHHELKKLFQQWSVLPWERARIPLIYVGDVLVVVVGYFIDERFSVKKNEFGFTCVWHSH